MRKIILFLANRKILIHQTARGDFKHFKEAIKELENGFYKDIA